MLRELVKNYAEHLDLSHEYINEVEESNGVFSFIVEGETLCSICEKHCEDGPGTYISIQAVLTGNLIDESLLEALDEYSDRLRSTPMYQRGFIIITENYTVGFSYEVLSEDLNADKFNEMMDLYVATVVALVAPEEQEEEKEEKREVIFEKYFKPHADEPYHSFLKTCNIDEKKLDESFGVLNVDEDFATHLEYHDLNGMLLMDNSFDCDDSRVLIDCLYVNGLGAEGASYEYSSDRLHVVSYLDPKKAKKDDFINSLLTHRFIVEKTQEYLDDEQKHVDVLDIKDIMSAMYV